jgi:hypothetical protein
VVWAEDVDSPGVLALNALGAALSMRSFQTHIRMMLGAEQLVIGRATLGIAVHFLPLNIKTLYTFSMGSLRICRHWNCLLNDASCEGVMGGWGLCEPHLSRMRSTECKNWTLVEQRTNKDEHRHITMGWLNEQFDPGGLREAETAIRSLACDPGPRAGLREYGCSGSNSAPTGIG